MIDSAYITDIYAKHGWVWQSGGYAHVAPDNRLTCCALGALCADVLSTPDHNSADLYELVYTSCVASVLKHHYGDEVSNEFLDGVVYGNDHGVRAYSREDYMRAHGYSEEDLTVQDSLERVIKGYGDYVRGMLIGAEVRHVMLERKAA